MITPRVAVALVAFSALVLTGAADAAGFSDRTAQRVSFRGEQRIVVVLATWGPQPFSPDDVRRVVFEETDAFIRASSFGQTWLTGAVTPWLQAFDGEQSCDPDAIRRGARAAAAGAGIDLTAWDRFVYLFPRTECGFQGLGLGEDVWLNGFVYRKLVAHELGHTYGLGHANAWRCDRGGCDSVEYGDPYDTMGRGIGDYNAFEKFKIGWLANVTNVAANGVYAIDRIEQPSTAAQALVVTTARSEYWFDHRLDPVPNPFESAFLPTGVLVRAGPNPRAWIDDLVFPMDNLLLPDPAGRGRPALLPGDTFREPGAFALTALRQRGTRMELRFAWTDRTVPRAPRIFDPGKAVQQAGSLLVTWGAAVERGSGLAYYEIRLDRRRPVRVELDDGVSLLVRFFKPPLGRHAVSVVAVDRAGNRGLVATRSFVVGPAKR